MHAVSARRACRLPFSSVAQAFQPLVLRFVQTSNTLHQTVQTVRPFAALRTQLLWPRLTSTVPSLRLTTRLARGQDGRSLRVRRVTFLPHTRRIYAAPVRMTWGFESIGPLAHQDDASYAVRVPRAGSLPAFTLPPWSRSPFRFRLTTDTLAVRLEVPAIKASTRTFTRQVTSWVAFANRLSSARS